MTKSLYYMLALVAVFTVGCNKDADNAVPTEGKPAKIVKIESPEKLSGTDFVTAVPGSQLTYEVIGTNRDVTFRIADASGSDDAKTVTFEVVEEGKVSDVFKWRLDSKGITQVTARKGVAFEPPQPLLVLPFKGGDEFRYEGKGAYPSVATGDPTSGALESISKVRGIEVVDTALGKIEAVAVQSITVYSSGKFTYREDATTWFSPKYGIVRYVQTVSRKEDNRTSTMRLRLKSLSTK